MKTALSVYLAAALLSTPAFAGTWVMEETSLVDLIPSGATQPMLGPVGELTTTQDVDFSAISDGFFGAPFTTQGGTDFFLSLGGLHIGDLTDTQAFWQGVWLTVAGPLVNGSVEFHGTDDEVSLSITNNMVTGTVGSDGTLVGCGNSQCAFTGRLVPQIPEPGPLAVMATGLLLLIRRTLP